MISMKGIAQLANKINAHRDELKPQPRNDGVSSGVIRIAVDFQTDDHPMIQVHGIKELFPHSEIEIELWNADCADEGSKYYACVFVDGVEFFELLSQEEADAIQSR